jgi:hypothetical protein
MNLSPWKSRTQADRESYVNFTQTLVAGLVLANNSTTFYLYIITFALTHKSKYAYRGN